MQKLWEQSVTLEAFKKKNTLPGFPGVYFFLDNAQEMLYIGKATSLRDRVKSYFSQDIMETRGPKIAFMLGRIARIAYRQTDSVLEALLLETKLIKECQPPYNTDQKDDKSYNDVVITDERFPRVLIVRGRDRTQGKFVDPVQHSFGPFPSGGGLREAMRIIRKLFPFRDTCVPYDASDRDRKMKAKPCFSAQIGLCPGVCTGEISAREYAKTIRNIVLFFEGKKGMIEKRLEHEMSAAAKRLDFERANDIKKTLFGLRHIQDMALVKDEGGERTRHRIEAYDAAHLAGSASVGVMTVVYEGVPASGEYRQFRLRGNHGGNDLSALEEILRRRFGHSEWPLPDMIVVDGNDLQRGVAERVLNEVGLSVPVVGVVKDNRHRPERIAGPEALAGRFRKEILLANGEAHRFTLTFHRKRRSKEFLVA